MSLNGVMAVKLRYFTQFGKPVFQHITASICGNGWSKKLQIFRAWKCNRRISSISGPFRISGNPANNRMPIYTGAGRNLKVDYRDTKCRPKFFHVPPPFCGSQFPSRWEGIITIVSLKGRLRDVQYRWFSW